MHSDEPLEQHHMLPAPDSKKEDDRNADSVEIDVNAPGSIAVKLDELGPMIVNSDGTLSRIANWTSMTEAERQNTLRVISARNKARLSNEKRKIGENL